MEHNNEVSNVRFGEDLYKKISDVLKRKGWIGILYTERWGENTPHKITAICPDDIYSISVNAKGYIRAGGVNEEGVKEWVAVLEQHIGLHNTDDIPTLKEVKEVVDEHYSTNYP